MYICWFQNSDWPGHLRRRYREYVIQIRFIFSARSSGLLRSQKLEFAVFASVYACGSDSRMKTFDETFDEAFDETFVETFDETFDEAFDKTFDENRFGLKKAIRENYIDHGILE